MEYYNDIYWVKLRLLTVAISGPIVHPSPSDVSMENHIGMILTWENWFVYQSSLESLSEVI
jgi:hypothetical protein